MALSNAKGVVVSSGHDNTIGGAVPGAGNVISGNNKHGIYLTNQSTHDIVMQGNYIGTDASGSAALGNAGEGIYIERSPSNTVGGTSSGARNVISANGGAGIRLQYNYAQYNTIQGNYIGTDVNGSAALGNTGPGIWIDNASDTTIGGTSSGAGNVVAFNGGDGVTLEYTIRNPIRSNMFWGNNGLGIDLDDDGVTTNDAGDGDYGANRRQNYPVLTSVTVDASSTTIIGTLSSTVTTTFDLDFYASIACDPSGYGEGQVYLGSDTVTTNGSGDANFVVTLGDASGYACFTATATNPDDETSEFSIAFKISGDAVYLPIIVRNQ